MDRRQRHGALNSGRDRRSRLQSDVNATLQEVRQIYADLAARPIERNCVRLKECCHFKLTGRTPYLTKGEALLAATALRASGRRTLPSNSSGACPLLDQETGNCVIYDSRPFGCRTHFCAAAGGPYSRREVIDLIRRLEAIDASLSGNGPQRLEGALSNALRELR